MPTSGNFSVNKFLNEKGVAHLFLLFILLAGIVGGLVLIRNPKIFAPKAAPVLPDKPEVSLELELEKNAQAPFPDDSTPSSIAPDSQFRVDLYARSDVEASNLFSAKIKYSTETVEFVKIEKREGQSFVKNWVDASVDNGVVNLVGGYPNPGIKTDSKAGAMLMGSIIFKSKSSGTVKIEVLDTSTIYSNSTNLNILTARKGAISALVQNSAPSPSPSPSPSAAPVVVSCNSVNVTGAVLTKLSGGEIVYTVDSGSGATLTADIVTYNGDYAQTTGKIKSFTKNLQNGGTINNSGHPNNKIYFYTAPVNNNSSVEGVTVGIDSTYQNKTASCPDVTFAIKPAIPNGSPTPTSTPIPFNEGPYQFKLTNTQATITCTKGDSDCGYVTTLTAINKLYKTLYGPYIYKSDPAGIIEGFQTPHQGSGSYAPGETVTIAELKLKLPVADGRYIATFYMDGRTCNNQTTPPNCIAYGASSINFTLDLNGSNVKIQVLNNSSAGSQPSPTPTVSPSPAPVTYLLGEFLETFGLTLSDAKFNSKYDYNSDGRISVVDYSGLLSKFDPKSFQLKTGYSVDELISTYNKLSTDAGFNAKYDVNSDKAVNKADYVILNQDTANGSGDGNNDGRVDFIDLSILLTDYNKNQGFRTGIDINGDGVINAFDFALMKNLLIKAGLVKSN